MKIAGGHLAYCLNVHPGESWAENLAAIRDHALRVRAAVAPGVRWGLGLRVAEQASRELAADPKLRRAAQEFFAAHDLYVFTINAFPFGRFHAGRVKENVYAPDWRTVERRDYTIRLAQLLADWLPPELDGSISTVPGSFKPWITSAGDVELMATRLRETALEFARIEQETGRLIHLGLEPEPSCFLEKTDETIRFFEEHLWRGPDEAAVRRHLGVCVDTCHVALQWEDPAEVLRRYAAIGLRVSKVQLSAALRGPATPPSLAALAAFVEPTYLHQVKARTGTEILSWLDLDEALRELPGAAAEELRVHFHVPLFHRELGALTSTATLLEADFWAALRAADCRHWEIETYTWDVLPAELRARDLVTNLAREWRWTAERLA